MKRAAILLLSLLPVAASAATIPQNMLMCTNSLYLDRAFSDLVKGQQIALDELINKGRCGFASKNIEGVEIERYGAVIKARFKEGSNVHTVYYSASELLMTQQKK